MHNLTDYAATVFSIVPTYTGEHAHVWRYRRKQRAWDQQRASRQQQETVQEDALTTAAVQ
jgi:hypothetical protein